MPFRFVIWSNSDRGKKFKKHAINKCMKKNGKKRKEKLKEEFQSDIH